MSKAQKIIEGLQILAKYSSGYFIQAEHDEIFAGDATPSPEDCARLRELGWIRDDDTEDEAGNTVLGTEGLWSIYT